MPHFSLIYLPLCVLGAIAAVILFVVVPRRAPRPIAQSKHPLTRNRPGDSSGAVPGSVPGRGQCAQRGHSFDSISSHGEYGWDQVCPGWPGPSPQQR